MLTRADRLNAILSHISPALKAQVEHGWGAKGCPYHIDEFNGKQRITIIDPSDGEYYSASGETMEAAMTKLEARVGLAAKSDAASTASGLPADAGSQGGV